MTQIDAANPRLFQYLQGVVCDGPARPDPSTSLGAGTTTDGLPHSDRHLVLLSYLRDCSGEASAEDKLALREAAVLEAERAARLGRVCGELARHRLDALVFKGAAHSYTMYPESHLRSRNDDDLWVRRADFGTACAVLEQLGYTPPVEITSPAITRQRHFARRDGVLLHQIDLHWWPVNPSAFDRLPDFDTCFAVSVPLTALGPWVRVPAPVHALLLACAHRVAHHTPTEDAMWLCDLHFLASALTVEDWGAFERIARDARVAQVCGLELSRARTVLGTPVPPEIIGRLVNVRGELSARYMRPLGPLGDLWRELTAPSGVTARARLLAEHLLPPREYVAARYGYHGVALLPLFYAHRAVNGLVNWTAQLMARLAR